MPDERKRTSKSNLCYFEVLVFQYHRNTLFDVAMLQIILSLTIIWFHYSGIYSTTILLNILTTQGDMPSR